MIRSTVLSKYLGTWVQVPVFAGSCSISQGAITSCFTVPGPSRPLSSKATASKLSVSGFLQAPHGFAVVGASAERQKFGNKAPPRSARSAGTLSRHLLLCSVERWSGGGVRRFGDLQVLRCYLQHGLSAVPVSLTQTVIEGGVG